MFHPISCHVFSFLILFFLGFFFCSIIAPVTLLGDLKLKLLSNLVDVALDIL